jgi:hypothetical protein
MSYCEKCMKVDEQEVIYDKWWDAKQIMEHSEDMGGNFCVLSLNIELPILEFSKLHTLQKMMQSLTWGKSQDWLLVEGMEAFMIGFFLTWNARNMAFRIRDSERSHPKSKLEYSL